MLNCIYRLLLISTCARSAENFVVLPIYIFTSSRIHKYPQVSAIFTSILYSLCNKEVSIKF